MAVNSTYSVCKSSKLPSREQKSTWHLSRYHFIGIYVLVKILVTKEELISEALNDSQDYCSSWQNIPKHRRDLLVEMGMGRMFIFSHSGALACHACVLRQVARGSQQKDHNFEREKEMRENFMEW